MIRSPPTTSRSLNGSDSTDDIHGGATDISTEVSTDVIERNREVLQVITTTMDNLAVVQNKGGKSADAEVLFRKALKITERLLGVEHPEVCGLGQGERVRGFEVRGLG